MKQAGCLILYRVGVKRCSAGSQTEQETNFKLSPRPLDCNFHQSEARAPSDQRLGSGNLPPLFAVDFFVPFYGGVAGVGHAQLVVTSLERHQLVVLAAFHDLATIDKHDLVTVFDG